MPELSWNPMPSIDWIASADEASYRDEHLGEVDAIDNPLMHLRVFLGDAPIAIAADRAAAELGLTGAKWAELVRTKKRSWLVRNSFSIKKSGGLLDPDAVGIELIFRDDSENLNLGENIHVHALLPGPQFRTVASVDAKVAANVGGNLLCRGVLLPPGTLSAQSEVASLADAGDGKLLGGSLRAQANAEASISISMTICTTRIAAIGTGDTRAQWEFSKESESLIDRDIETWTGLLLSSNSRSISFKARVQVVFGASVFRYARTTDWTMLACDLR
jgi:hypothetical protein